MALFTTACLSDLMLDYAVAKCQGDTTFPPRTYSTDWAFGGQILDQERISIEPFKNTSAWSAFKFDSGDCAVNAPTALVAVMRCYVASKLGSEIDIPDSVGL